MSETHTQRTHTQSRSVRIMGKKCGMTQMFDKNGALVACTVIEVEPNTITQIKTKEIDGYEAVQVAADAIRTKDARTIEKRVNKPQLGHFNKIQVAPCRHLKEFRVDDTSSYSVGATLGLEQFEGVLYVDAVAVSKGKGYQGVMKKYGFRGGPAAHGSGFHRHAGSTGMRSTPGRCLPGGPRPSHMGSNQVTVQNLRVVAIDAKNNLLVVEGAVPGAKNALVTLVSAKKKQKQSVPKKS